MLISRSIALIYLIAFSSLFSQIGALFYEDGISPIKTLMARTKFTQVPSLFQITNSDSSILFLCVLGFIISGLLALKFIKGKYTRAALFFVLYIFYLSFVNASGVFLSFQWDALLLESGLLMIVLELARDDERTKQVATWLFWILIFKLMFMSGIVKFASGDPSWANFTAMEYHYQTQPLPNPLSVFFYYLPAWFHKFSCIAMFAIELIVPFFIFCGKRMRHIAGLSFIFLQLLILLTGNYCFFNLLTIVLCIPLLDFEQLKLVKLNLLKDSDEIMISNPGISSFLDEAPLKRRRLGRQILTVILVLYSSVSLIHILYRSGLEIEAINKATKTYLKRFGAYYFNSPYGLFAVMTTKRYEIIFQGANNVPGQLAKSDWKSYEFKYKPGSLNRIPPQIAPFQPRLDWQMWFAALSSYKRNPWLVNFATKLLENNEEVLKLLKSNPYPDKAPDYVRALIYEYKFAKLNDSDTWTRELKGLYLPAISLKTKPES